MADININNASLEKKTDFTNTSDRGYASKDGSTKDAYFLFTELFTYLNSLYVRLTTNQTIAGEKTFSNNLKVNAQAHGGDSLEIFSASKTFNANDGDVFEMDVTASTTISIENELAGVFIFRLKIDTATPPIITVDSSFGTKLPNASLDFDYTDQAVNILTLTVWTSGAKDYTISN